MWMPSKQPLLDGSADVLALDWETIGRAIRECVLDAIEMHAAEPTAPQSDIESSHQPKPGMDVE